MRKDEYALTKELRRLEKYGILLQAKRVGYVENEGYKYNILFTEDKRVLEPECGVSEVMGIINALETCLDMFLSFDEDSKYQNISLLLEDIKKGKREISNEQEKKLGKAPEPNQTLEKNSLTDNEQELFEILRDIRLQYARNGKLPPYYIFNDKTLIDMCKKMPQNKQDMLKVYGVGENKYEKYGDGFLKTIIEYKKNLF